MQPSATVLFDGICNLCNASIRFIIANDPGARFRFAPLTSAAGIAALAAHGRAPADVASIILIDAAGLHERSDAALRIAAGLRWPWRMAGMLRAIPAGLRDPFYELVARNRYRWFGRQAACPLPTPAQRERFL